MRIIISPAKKMRIDTESFSVYNLPEFILQTEILCKKMKDMDYDSLKKLWKCNDQITALNIKRLREIDLYSGLTPALLAYEGIQYLYMAPNVFTQEALEYVREHLRILSGFYGMLRPFDGVTPYRLEMQAKLPVNEHKDLYSFWGSRLSESLQKETDCILNLASKEYSNAVLRHLSPYTRFLTCVFGEEKNGKIIEKGIKCKMARGEMVRYLAEHQIDDVVGIKAFSGLGYQFHEEYSDENNYVFLLRED